VVEAEDDGVCAGAVPLLHHEATAGAVAVPGFHVLEEGEGGGGETCNV